MRQSCPYAARRVTILLVPLLCLLALHHADAQHYLVEYTRANKKEVRPLALAVPAARAQPGSHARSYLAASCNQCAPSVAVEGAYRQSGLRDQEGSTSYLRLVCHSGSALRSPDKHRQR